MTKQSVSEFADGELEGREAAAAYAALRGDAEAQEAWRRYHLISDAMRDTRVLSAGFEARFAARLAAEPTVIGRPLSRAPERPLSWYATRAAAGLAGVAFVGFAAFSLNEPGSAPVAQVKPAAPLAVAEPAQVQPTEAVRDYMQAHQGFSPRNGLQGHVQTVSSKAVR